MPTTDRIVGGYILRRKLGRGGNADVWEAAQPGEKAVALKLLRTFNPQRESYRRFCREVEVHARLTNEVWPGVLPLLAYRLPERPSIEDPAWLTMPMGEELIDALGPEPNLEDVVAAVAAIAETLSRLHERGIAHRDVKPSNCYRYAGTWVISDFGLIQMHIDDQQSLTVGAKALGPRNFIAPEMLLYPERAEGPPADVYSIGKTLWALAAGLPIAPIGEHRPELPGKRLTNWGVSHPRAFYLDRLIDQATREVPGERPKMSFVATTLLEWIVSPKNSGETALSLDDSAGAISDVLARDRRVAALRHSRQSAADDVVSRLAKRMPEILERLDGADIANSGLTSDHTGVAQVLAGESAKIPEVEVASWQTSGIQRNTGHGAFGFLRFGAGAALSRQSVLVMAVAYHLSDRNGQRILWSDTDVALLGSSDCEAKVRRLAEGLVTNLPQALAEFYSAIAD